MGKIQALEFSSLKQVLWNYPLCTLPAPFRALSIPCPPFYVVKLPSCVKLSILPNKNSSCLYAALG